MTKWMMMMLHANTYKSNLEGNHKYTYIQSNTRSLNHTEIVLIVVVVKVDTCKKETIKREEREKKEETCNYLFFLYNNLNIEKTKE
jgi:hypothetical protein